MAVLGGQAKASPLRVVYTALHGVGAGQCLQPLVDGWI